MRGNIKKFNFRMLHHNYVLIVNPEESLINTVGREFEMIPGDNAILTYGYIDTEAGISFEVLCIGRYTEDQPIQLREGAPKTSFKIRYDSVSGEVMNLEFNEYFLSFYKKVKRIDEGYKSNEVAEAFRQIEGVDQFRHPQFPDDLLVYFVKDGLKTEQMWVRLCDMKAGLLAGHLMNEPYSDFGIHQGELVGINCVRGNEALMPVADL